ncbi:leucine-rich pentatricopeptide repeat containing 2 [Arctopsyche grandis]|uniref:leucine-rich pentatricopeptide repeat containing 2 n=1 Tax=Arctopsyche grandis TaxID=121162 RepID=UPI00406D8456
MFNFLNRYTLFNLNRHIHLKVKLNFINGVRNEENQIRRLASSHRICYNQESYKNFRQYSVATSVSPNTKPELIKMNLSKVLDNIYFIINKTNRVYEKNVLDAISFASQEKFLDLKTSLTLIKCCSNILLDESPEKRMVLVNQVWEILTKASKLDLDHYNELLKCYIDNNHIFDVNDFLKNMLPIEPSGLTYQLLLTAACNVGDMQQALEIIEKMKGANIIVSEIVFNSLIEGYGKSGNIAAALDIVDTIKSTVKTISSETEKSIIVAHIYCKDSNGVKGRLLNLENSNINLTEIQIVQIIKYLGRSNMNDLIPNFISLLPLPVLSSISYRILNMCTQLIHQGYSKTAYLIYDHISKIAIGTNNIDFYIKSLVRETVRASNNLDDISFITEQLEKSGKNDYVTYTALQTALYSNKTDIALGLMGLLKKQNKPVRCHFFWPLLVALANSDGEAGIFKVISSMIALNVMPDFDTLTDYVIPHVNILDPQDLIKKLKLNGVTSLACITPVIYRLIKDGDTKSAADICDLTQGNLDTEKLIAPLVAAFLSNYDVDSVHNIIKAIEKRALYENKDWIGKFFINLFSQRNWDTDKKKFVELIVALSESNTKVSMQSIDKCVYYLNRLDSANSEFERIKQILSTMVDNSKKTEDIFAEHQTFGHQRDMNLEQLKAHLLELQSKNMNVRGVLRKLLQKHCQLGNFNEAIAVLKKCEENKIYLSDGMTASVMDLYVKSNDLKNAEKYYHNLLKSQSNFDLDNFKIMDYTTLLVKNNRLQDAINILEKTAYKIRMKGGVSLERNCWRLLEAVATTISPTETEKMLSLLSRLGYCKISNILLGPVIRAHLLRSDIYGAVNEFVNCGNKYRKTPLKHELLTILVMGSHDYQQVLKKKDTELSLEKGIQMQKDYQNLLIQVQDTDKKVHGAQSARLALMAALAECGLTKPLRRYVINPSFAINHEDVNKQCLRFFQENKVIPLETLAECLEGVRNVERNEIYHFIIKIHKLNDNCDSAVSVWDKMIEQQIKPTKNTIDILISMLKANHRDIPHTLANAA